MNYLKNHMKKISRIKKLVTHDGLFHSDDVFACATISLLLEKKKEKFKIFRTRDEKIINNGDYVFDVGGIFDENKNRFDHHQKGGAGKRENGIEYASFGLVWRKYGPMVAGSLAVAKIIDENIASPIDVDDNGISIFKKTSRISPFLIQDFVKLMRPAEDSKEENYDMCFMQMVNIAKTILLRSILHAKETQHAELMIAKAYKDAANKKIIILNKYYPPGKIFYKFPEVLFLIYYKEINDTWVVKTINKDGEDYISRKDFPLAWGGLEDENLQKMTGVKDAIFCHKGLFLAVAKTKKGAIKLAEIAVKS